MLHTEKTIHSYVVFFRASSMSRFGLMTIGTQQLQVIGKPIAVSPSIDTPLSSSKDNSPMFRTIIPNMVKLEIFGNPNTAALTNPSISFDACLTNLCIDISLVFAMLRQTILTHTASQKTRPNKAIAASSFRFCFGFGPSLIFKMFLVMFGASRFAIVSRRATPRAS